LSNYYTLSVDTLGSETKIEDILLGLNQSLERNLNIRFILFGNSIDLKNKIRKYKALSKASEIVDCQDVVTMSDSPSEIIKIKQNSTMARAISSISENSANAVLSFGNTGALMSFSLLGLRTMKEIRRPAIASIWPNLKGDSIILDLGANTKLDSRFLIDNALLGASLASVLFKINSPSVGLLNVGTEKNKGNEEIKIASEKLSQLSNDNILNYHGYIEGNDISLGKTNVVVTDGFTGNIALKTAEGTAKLFQSHLNNAFRSSFISRIGYFFSSIALTSVRERLDPRVHNCGILMGLNGLVVKCHGQSEYKGVSYAADIIYSLLSNNVHEKIEEYIRKIHLKLKD
tara:strand:+ start:814 stop:1848 length:1035 start_codon:yes stop_codon:yes gene_type:complete